MLIPLTAHLSTLCRGDPWGPALDRLTVGTLMLVTLV